MKLKPYLPSFLDRVCATMADAGDCLSYMRKIRTDIDIVKNIPYQNTGLSEHTLDIYRPRTGSKPFPIILYIHGGGFITCSKETHRAFALILASFGFCVFNINYRLCPKYKYPVAIYDTCHAFDWVCKNARIFGGNEHRILVAGESAGANLALALGVASSYQRTEPYARLVFDNPIQPVGLFSISGLLQVSDPFRFKNVDQARLPGIGKASVSIVTEVAKAYLGRQMLYPSDENIMADPLRIIESATGPDRNLPFIMASVGTADLVYDDTKRLEKAINQTNGNIFTSYYPNELHGFYVAFWRSVAFHFWKNTFNTLQQYGLVT